MKHKMLGIFLLFFAAWTVPAAAYTRFIVRDPAGLTALQQICLTLGCNVSGGLDGGLGERVDQGLLERAQVPVQVAAIAAQVQDGIADELPRAVERDVAGALHLDDGQVARPKHVARARVTAQRHDRRVLEQQGYGPPPPPADAPRGGAAPPLQAFLGAPP